MEVWKNIEGYEGLYQVSDKGRVRSLHYRNSSKTKIMSPVPNNRGYLIIGLRNKSKKKGFCLHRLVASAFLPNPQNMSQVNHKDGDRSNNCVENLEWCTALENIHHSITSLHKDRSVNRRKPVICVETGEVFSSYVAAERATGISCANIGAAVRGDVKKDSKGYKYKCKSAGGYHWCQYKVGLNG